MKSVDLTNIVDSTWTAALTNNCIGYRTASDFEVDIENARAL